MDCRPIGVFDSGIGGIPVLKKLTERFPRESFIYLGDNANVPYGSKKKEEIIDLTLSGIDRLFSLGVKAAVVACNTASTAVRDLPLKNVALLVPDIDAEKYKNKKGLFIATPATVESVTKSGEWDSLYGLSFLSLPQLAEQIEKQFLFDHRCDLRDHFLTTEKTVDFVYLGCTHYLFAKEEIGEMFNTNDLPDGIDHLVEKLTKLILNAQNLTNCVQTVKFAGDFADFNKRVFKKLAENRK